MSSTSYTDGDWTYTLDENDNATITAYNGTDTDLTFPSTVGTDYTVVAIGTEGGMDYTSRATIVSAHIPDTVTALSSAFYECSALESVDLPAGLTTIGDYTFNFCYSLASITIPRTVTSIGDYAFDECYSLTSITFLSGTAPTLGSDALTLGTSVHSAECTVYSLGNWASGALGSYINQYTTLTYEPYVVTYRPLTYEDAKIQVESAIRDGNGVRIDTNYQRKPAVYERTTYSSASTPCTLIQFNALDYKANGYLAHFRFRVRSVLQDAYPSDNEFIINYSYRTASIVALNSKYTTTYHILYAIYAYYPSSNTSIDTNNYFIAFTTGRTDTDFILEVMEADIPYTVPATMSASDTANTSYQSLPPGSYTSARPLMWTDVAVGSITGNANASISSNSTYGTKQKVFRVGEADTYKVMAVDHTGVAYKINTSTKKFPLPINMYWGYGGGANSTSYSNQYTSFGAGANLNPDVSYLSSSTVNGFTLPTLTTSDGGKTLYVRGSLDADGYFVCDGNVTLSMAPGYTYIPFGTLNPKYSGTTAQVPTTYSFNAISAPAYTLDSNGKLTHIDGKQIAPNITVSDQAPSGGSNGDIWIQY